MKNWLIHHVSETPVTYPRKNETTTGSSRCFPSFGKYPCHLSEGKFLFTTKFERFSEFRMPCHLWEENRFHLTSNCRAIFPLNSLKNQQQMDNAEILHFNFDTYKILMQKFCRAILLLNSLKNQQQMDNAEILHFSFEKYKICMQSSAELYFAKIIIKTAYH